MNEQDRNLWAALTGAHQETGRHIGHLAQVIENAHDASQLAGLLRQLTITLNAIDNPARVARSEALRPIQSVWVDNPNPLPILLGFDVDALPNTAQMTLGPYRGRMLPIPHESLSVGFDPLLVSELVVGAFDVFIAQYDRAYTPSSMALNPAVASVVTPQTLSLADANVHQTALNLPAASVLIQAKDTNTSPVAYGTPATLAIGTDTGVWGRLTAGQSTVLEIANTDLVAFQTAVATQVVYVTALR
jgi:hypothetical protein